MEVDLGSSGGCEVAEQAMWVGGSTELEMWLVGSIDLGYVQRERVIVVVGAREGSRK